MSAGPRWCDGFIGFIAFPHSKVKPRNRGGYQAVIEAQRCIRRSLHGLCSIVMPSGIEAPITHLLPCQLHCSCSHPRQDECGEESQGSADVEQVGGYPACHC